VWFEAAPGDPYSPNSTPIYQTATFAQERADEFGEYDYSRSGNPTRTVLEKHLATLERADRAFAFASGLAALAAVIRLVPAGGHVVAGDDPYGGTYRLLTKLAPRAGVSVSWADATDPDAIAAAIRPETRLILVETPTNPLQKIIDIRAVAAVAKDNGVLLCVDNSMLSPWLQRPLTLGADIVIHSATKYLGGHSDVTAGVVAVNGGDIAERIYAIQNGEGAVLGPFDCWVLLRGIKTLGLRVERQQQNAETIARYLAAHPAVTKVHYAGLPEHPGSAIQARQARGAGGVLAFETGDRAVSKRIVESLQYFTISVSFGSVNSLVSLPSAMSHAAIPADVRLSRGENVLPDDLIRISAGIEDVQDLIEDIDRALLTCTGKSREREALTCS
jgi:cystathionine beta-lyase